MIHEQCWSCMLSFTIVMTVVRLLPLALWPVNPRFIINRVPNHIYFKISFISLHGIFNSHLNGASYAFKIPWIWCTRLLRSFSHLLFSFIGHQTIRDIVIITGFYGLCHYFRLYEQTGILKPQASCFLNLSPLCCIYSAYCTYKVQDVYIGSPIFIIMTTKSVYSVYHCTSANVCIQCVHIYTERECLL